MYSLSATPTAYKPATVKSVLGDVPDDSPDVAGYEMAAIVGRILEYGGSCVRSLACDNASNQQLIIKLLIGDVAGIDQEIVAKLDFFSKLRYQPLLDIPSPVRLPYQIALYEGEAIWMISGPLQPSGLSSRASESFIFTISLKSKKAPKRIPKSSQNTYFEHLWHPKA